MCRQYKFRFAECGHINSHPDWLFSGNHHPEDCELKTVVIDRPQHCFQCLGQETMPAERRNLYARRANLALCSDRFSKIFRHHIKHPSGPMHFDKNNPRALIDRQRSMTEVDRLYVMQFEEECDDLLWAMKDLMEKHRNPDLKQRFVDQRKIGLQLRFAHLTAQVHALEVIELSYDNVKNAHDQWLRRCANRVQALCTIVKEEELTEDDECPICYCSLLQATRPDATAWHTPVRLPCGHMFSKLCIYIWLTGENRNCPKCRSYFNLTQDNIADFDGMANNLLDRILNRPAVPTPWWVTMLRSE